MATRTLVAAVLVPCLLGALVIFQLALGGNTLPTWITSIAVRQGHDELQYLRMIAALEIVFALALIGLGRSAVPLAWLTLVVIGFTALAECSAAFRNGMTGAFVGALIVLAISAALAVALARSRRPEDEPAAKSRTGAIRWTALCVLILVGLSIVLNIPIAPRTLAEGRPLEPPDPTRSSRTAVFDLEVNAWEGREIKEIDLTTYVPELKSLTAEGRSLVVLYNRGCGECHDLFEVHFGEGFHVPVIAIEIPIPEGAVLAPNARTDEVNCPECIFTSLPYGPHWLMTPPIVLLVEDGRILCVESVEPSRCIDGS